MSTIEMTHQDYIDLICRILQVGQVVVERPLPDPLFDKVVGFAIEANQELRAWKEMCYRNLNGQAEGIIAEVCAIIQPDDPPLGEAKPGEAAPARDSSTRQGEAPKPAFELLDDDEFIKRPPKKWLVDKFLGERDFGMLFGLPGEGKTFVTLDFVYSLASAQKFAGYFGIARPCRVLYCSDEGIEGLKARFKEVKQRYAGKVEPGMVKICLTMPQLFLDVETGWQHFLNDIVGKFTPDLIVLDTLFNATVGMRENVADDAGVAIHNAKAIRDALGCAMLFNHHPNKGNDWPRGTGAWIGSMDLIAQVGSRVMSCYKAKDATEFPGIGFNLVESGESAVVEWTGATRAPSKGEQAEAIINEFVPDGTNTRSLHNICKELGVGKDAANRAMTNLIHKTMWRQEHGPRGSIIYSRVKFEQLRLKQD